MSEKIAQLLKDKGITPTTKHHSYDYLYATFIEVAQSYHEAEMASVSSDEEPLIEPLRNFIRSKHLSSEWEYFLDDYLKNKV